MCRLLPINQVTKHSIFNNVENTCALTSAAPRKNLLFEFLPNLHVWTLFLLLKTLYNACKYFLDNSELDFWIWGFHCFRLLLTFIIVLLYYYCSTQCFADCIQPPVDILIFILSSLMFMFYHRTCDLLPICNGIIIIQQRSAT